MQSQDHFLRGALLVKHDLSPWFWVRVLVTKSTSKANKESQTRYLKIPFTCVIKEKFKMSFNLFTIKSKIIWNTFYFYFFY